MKRYRVPFVVSLFFVLVAGCGDSERKTWSRCSNTIDGVKYEFECATLKVPLQWDQPDGATIDLFIRRRLGTQERDNTNHAQLWLLQGGPGISGLPYAPLVKAITSTTSIDVYVPDHRGTGNSTRLSCPEYERSSSAGGTDVTFTEINGCLQSATKKWGEDLAEFTTTAAARDVGYAIEQLSQQDGITQDVFVYGSSYGTYWANRYFQIYPDQAAGGILDSVVSPTLTFLTVGDDYETVGVDLLSNYCAADTTCNAKLGGNPMQFIIDLLTSIENGHCSQLTTSLNLASQRELESEFKGVFSVLLADWYLRVYIPPVLYRLNRCNEQDVNSLHILYDLILKAVFSPNPQMSTLLYLNVALSELWGNSPPSVEDLDAQEQLDHFHSSSASVLRPLYDTWPRYPHDSYYGLWADTSIPLLILQGGLDPQTPFAQASAAETHFTGPHQYFVTFPTSPHGIIAQSPMPASGSAIFNLTNQCGFQIMLSFLNDRFSKPDLTCINEMQPIVFANTLQISEALFGTTNYWGDQLTLNASSDSDSIGEQPALPPIHPSPFPIWNGR